MFFRESDAALFALDPLAADCLSVLAACTQPLTARALRDQLRDVLAPTEYSDLEAVGEAWFEDLLVQLAQQGIVQVSHA